MACPKPGWAKSAASFVLFPANGTVLHAHNADAKRAPASLVKCMTAFLVYDAAANGTLALEANATAPPEVAKATGARLGLKPGEQVPVRELLAAMLVGSANDAATTLAVHVAGNLPNFLAAMNAKATALGMTNTHFATPHGLPAKGQYSTARDMTLLAAALIKAHPQVLAITSQRELWVGERYLKSYNDLLAIDGVDGLKTGSTRLAGACLIATALVPTAGREETRVILVLLGAKNPQAREQEGKAMLEMTASALGASQ